MVKGVADIRINLPSPPVKRGRNGGSVWIQVAHSKGDGGLDSRLRGNDGL